MRRLITAGLLSAVLSGASAAQSGVIRGVVYDSVGQSFLANATVQLVSADGSGRVGRSVLADAGGNYVIAGVPDGIYTLGFLHPVLDSLGVEPPMRQVRVRGGEVRADLAIPSADRLRTVVCGSGSRSDSGAVILGIVRGAATHAPIAGASVTVEWMELTIGVGGTRSHIARRDAITAANGWFGVCGVPQAGTIALRARRGADSTDLIDVTMQSDRLVRHDLYLAEHAAGTLTLRGVATRNPDGTPILGAEVTIGGVSGRSNGAGEWTLQNVPAGTRELEVRAVGYFQLHTPVNVIDSVAPIPIALTTLRAVLDTVKVQSTPLEQIRRQEFEDRRRTGLGKFITEEDIARRNPMSVSELFRTVSGVTMNEPVGSPNRRIWMRGLLADQCNPAIFVDGHFMSQLDGDEVDAIANPDEVAGIEVYSATLAPPQFNATLSSSATAGCGSIVIWTKAGPRPRADASSWRRLATLGAVGVAILAGFVIR